VNGYAAGMQWYNSVDQLRLRLRSLRRAWRNVQEQTQRVHSAMGVSPDANVINMQSRAWWQALQQTVLRSLAVMIGVAALMGITVVVAELLALWMILRNGFGLRIVPPTARRPA
jgi:hypothetical protein